MTKSATGYLESLIGDIYTHPVSWKYDPQWYYRYMCYKKHTSHGTIAVQMWPCVIYFNKYSHEITREHLISDEIPWRFARRLRKALRCAEKINRIVAQEYLVSLLGKYLF